MDNVVKPWVHRSCTKEEGMHMAVAASARYTTDDAVGIKDGRPGHMQRTATFRACKESEYTATNRPFTLSFFHSQPFTSKPSQ